MMVDVFSRGNRGASLSRRAKATCFVTVCYGSGGGELGSGQG